MVRQPMTNHGSLLADLSHMVERELDIAVMRNDQNELRRQIRNLKRDALMDPVLGMWNRNAIVRSLGLEMERCARAEKPLSLLFIGVEQYAKSQRTIWDQCQ